MENQPTLAYVCQKRTRAGPKMGMDPGLACPAAQDCARMGSGVKHPPKVTQTCPELAEGMDTRNGETRHVLSLPRAGAGDQAASRDGVGCRVSFAHAEANAWGNAARWNIARYADVGRVTGKVRVLAEVEL